MQYRFIDPSELKAYVVTTAGFECEDPIRWLREYPSDGIFHYVQVYRRRETVWRFTKEEDAIMFRLKFA